MFFSWHGAVGIVAGLVQIGSIIPYIRGMVYGTTRPNLVSWSLWTLLQSIAIAAQFSSGASWSILLLVATTFNTALVVIIAILYRFGYRHFGWVDGICLILAIVAIGLWQSTREPTIALFLAILADFIVAIPTVVKTYRDPHSEVFWAWFMVTVASLLSIVATTRYDFVNLAFPVYFFILTGFVSAMILVRQSSMPCTSIPPHPHQDN